MSHIDQYCFLVLDVCNHYCCVLVLNICLVLLFVGCDFCQLWLFIDSCYLLVLNICWLLLFFALVLYVGSCLWTLIVCGVSARKWLYDSSEGMPVLQFLLWILFPIVLICFSSGFVHLVGPNAIGKLLLSVCNQQIPNSHLVSFWKVTYSHQTLLERVSRA